MNKQTSLNNLMLLSGLLQITSLYFGITNSRMLSMDLFVVSFLTFTPVIFLTKKWIEALVRSALLMTILPAVLLLLGLTIGGLRFSIVANLYAVLLSIFWSSCSLCFALKFAWQLYSAENTKNSAETSSNEETATSGSLSV